MKKFSMVMLFIMSLWGSHALSAIGCVPGDCCGGRSCSAPPRPNPPYNPGPCGSKATPAVLGLITDNRSCTSVQVLDCSSCGTGSVSCARNYDENGQSAGFSCIQCDK